MPQAYETIGYEQDGSVATITMNRPEKRNALSPQLRHELEQGWVRASDDDSVSVIVFRAEGPDFSAGLDMFAGEGRFKDVARAQENVIELQERWLRLRDVPKPTIAQVHGNCIAFATQFCICCDIVVVADDARIGVPVMPNDWYADWWVYRVGAQRAKLLNFTVGSAISGLEAVEWGFAARAFPADRLTDETQRLARWIGKTPLQVLRLKKQAINQVEDLMGFRTAARYTASHNTMVSRSDASQEVRAFMSEHGLAATRDRFAPSEPD